MEILSKYNVVVVNRCLNGESLLADDEKLVEDDLLFSQHKKNIHLIPVSSDDAGAIISSTLTRELISQGECVSHMVPEKVDLYLEDKRLYR